MLDMIKSRYILKLIFLNVRNERKLKLIMENKKLMDKLNINLLDYKLLRGKYFIGNKNGKGKEYNSYNDKLIFEGEYIDGKRFGYGKEYNNDNKLIFEGKYFNGKRNGKGKEYFDDGTIKFEGIYFFGIKYNGKGYSKNNEILYELKEGKGYVYELDFCGNLIYEGEYLNGKKNGIGKEYYKESKTKFEGIYKNDRRWNGIGYDINNKIIYELKKGKGYVYELNNVGKLIFKGEYLNGIKNGKGKEYDNDILIFEGEYVNGKRSGRGKEYNHKEKIFEGQYAYDSKIRGKFYHNNKLEFEGEFLFNKKWTGNGYDKNGNIIYKFLLKIINFLLTI